MGDDPPTDPSGRKLMERESDRRAEGCLTCGDNYLPGFVENGDERGAGWTLLCSNAKCRDTYDIWDACCDAMFDGNLDYEID